MAEEAAADQLVLVIYKLFFFNQLSCQPFVFVLEVTKRRKNGWAQAGVAWCPDIVFSNTVSRG